MENRQKTKFQTHFLKEKSLNLPMKGLPGSWVSFLRIFNIEIHPSKVAELEINKTMLLRCSSIKKMLTDW